MWLIKGVSFWLKEKPKPIWFFTNLNCISWDYVTTFLYWVKLQPVCLWKLSNSFVFQGFVVKVTTEKLQQIQDGLELNVRMLLLQSFPLKRNPIMIKMLAVSNDAHRDLVPSPPVLKALI